MPSLVCSARKRKHSNLSYKPILAVHANPILDASLHSLCQRLPLRSLDKLLPGHEVAHAVDYCPQVWTSDMSQALSKSNTRDSHSHRMRSANVLRCDGRVDWFPLIRSGGQPKHYLGRLDLAVLLPTTAVSAAYAVGQNCLQILSHRT